VSISVPNETPAVAAATLQRSGSSLVLEQLRDYTRIEQAIEYLERHYQRQPLLTEVADAIGLSEYHFQRLFRRWAGVSPKRYLQFLTVEHAKAALREGQSVLHAAIDSGLSGPGRLHDHFVSLEAVTPGEYRNHGQNVAIAHGVHPSPFGYCFVAGTDRGICRLEFLERPDAAVALERLHTDWKAATFHADINATAHLADRVFETIPDASEPLTLAIRGTNFQIQVWRALLQIPAGTLASYQDIARATGHPGAARAVGRAIGQNPVAYLIPCHRAIRKTGEFGNYRWGTARKKAILGWEASHHSVPRAS
jgi:AraC family transcriptional regulator of adaptative response/methylated-DNA-[protein]-cysteine methyltransferase